MKENEIIFVNSIPDDVYYQIVIEAIKYAIISIPFTIDRMRLGNKNLQILNIAKGKIAEGLFKFFCQKNNIPANFQICETPFYQIDKRDFFLDDAEWDQKNNFIYHRNNEMISQRYVDLPALITNRHNRKDQWQKSKVRYLKNSQAVKFLFTFMKASDKKTKKDNFFSNNLSEKRMKFLNKLYSNYRGLPQEKQPFEEEDFWGEIKYRKNGQRSFSLHCKPNLVITGYADKTKWDLFFNTEKENLLNGVLNTKIRNKT